jgi:hypothetical protein
MTQAMTDGENESRTAALVDSHAGSGIDSKHRAGADLQRHAALDSELPAALDANSPARLGSSVEPAAPPAAGAAERPGARPSLKHRLSALFNQYGTIAVATYFALSILTIIAFTLAFAVGVAPENATGVFGVIVAGWVAAKATLPIRILITLGLTPAVAFVVNRRRRTPGIAGGDGGGGGDAGDAGGNG